MKFFQVITLLSNMCFVVFSLPNLHPNCPKDENVVVCYYANWAVYRSDLGQFNHSNIDPYLCTHIIYAFAGLDTNSKITSLDPQTDIVKVLLDEFKKVTALKRINPCLKVMLAVGGWNEESRKFSVMAYTQKSREEFVDSVLRFLVSYDFDGLDVDWEYPGQRGGIPDDRVNFVELLKLLREKFKVWGLLLSIAVPMSRDVCEEAFDVTAIANHVDFISLMTYDLSVCKQTQLLSSMKLIRDAVEWWRRAVDPRKLVIGLATNAKSYTLKNKDDTGLGAEIVGAGPAGRFTKIPGFLSFYELKMKLTSNRYKHVKNEEDAIYYTYYKNEWITYDLEDTYKLKAEYARLQGLLGVMIWTIDTDDFSGLYAEPFPILKAVNAVLRPK